jgi:hypothetical protein
MVRCCQNVNTFFDDTRFYPGDISNSRSQVIHMVHAYIGNNGKPGHDDICGVNSPSHAYFNYGQVYFFPGKIQKSQSRAYFKFRWVFLARRHHLV